MSDEDIRMAKQLGMGPRSLIKNIPAPSQQWKLPVREWVRSLYEEKFGPPPAKAVVPAVVIPAVQPDPNRVIDPEHPWPDRPKIPELAPYKYPDIEWNEDPFDNWHEPPPESLDEQNIRILRHQSVYRWAAQWVALTISKLPEIQKVVAFGAVAQPLQKVRRRQREVFHECADLDLAVWTLNFKALKELKNAMSDGLEFVQASSWGGVAHHQVDVHVFDAGTGEYRGRLCIFGQCPKSGKRNAGSGTAGRSRFFRRRHGCGKAAGWKKRSIEPRARWRRTKRPDFLPRLRHEPQRGSGHARLGGGRKREGCLQSGPSRRRSRTFVCGKASVASAAQVNYHFGCAYSHLGLADKSARYFDEAARIDPKGHWGAAARSRRKGAS